jgi:hypothetical protein
MEVVKRKFGGWTVKMGVRLMKTFLHRLRIPFLSLLMASIVGTGLFPVVQGGRAPLRSIEKPVLMMRPQNRGIAPGQPVALSEKAVASKRLANAQRELQTAYRQLPAEFKKNISVFQNLFFQGGFYSEINEQKVLCFLDTLQRANDSRARQVLDLFGEVLISKVLRNVACWPMTKISDDENLRSIEIRSYLEAFYAKDSCGATKVLFQAFVIMSRHNWKAQIRSQKAYELVSEYAAQRPHLDAQTKSFLNAFQTFIVHGSKYGSVWFRHGKKIMIGSAITVALGAGAFVVAQERFSAIAEKLYLKVVIDTIKNKAETGGFWSFLKLGFSRSKITDPKVKKEARGVYLSALLEKMKFWK